MGLRSKQSTFAKNIGHLIEYAYAHGYELTFGDAYRDAETMARRGHPRSNHGNRLAVDFNLFIDGVYVTTTAAHTPLGTFWKSLDKRNAWGGDFRRPDGNHYSMEHGGRK